MIHRVGRCLECGETYAMTGEDDFTHVAREDGTECGGPGVFAGSWVPATAADMNIRPVPSSRSRIANQHTEESP